MEGVGSLYALGSAVGAMAGSPASGFLFESLRCWWQKRKLRNRVRGLIMMKGVSTACEKLTNTDTVFIDTDKLLQNLQLPADADEASKKPEDRNPVDKLMCYSIIKKHILNICSVWKGRIVLVSRHLDLLEMLPVQYNHIYFCAFSKDAEKNLGVIYHDEKEHAESQLNKFRVLQQLPEEQVFIVDSLKDAYDAIKIRFDCRTQML